MTKISVSRLMDLSATLEGVKKAKVEGLDTFIQYVSDFSDQVITAMRNRLSVSDNLDALERTVTLKNGIAQKVENDAARTPKHVLCTQVRPFANSLATFNWELDSEQQIRVKATFDPVPADTVTVKLIILY